MNNNFSVSARTAGDIAVMLPKGYINDIGAESLEHVCEDFFNKGMKKLIINFAEIQFINSIGASIFTGIVQRALEYKSQLCFTNMKKVHRDVFEILGITKHAKVFKDEQEALSFLNAGN